MSTHTALDAICDLFIANAASISTYLDLNNITMNHSAKAIELFDIKFKGVEYDPKVFLDSIESEMERAASDLIGYIERHFAIYDLLESDLTKGRGYANLLSIAADYYTHGESVKHNLELNAIQQKANAQRIASSKVTGLGFGIVSNSLAAHLIYNAQSEAAIKKQTAEAKEYLSTRNIEISMRASEKWHLAQMQYFRSTLGPRMREAIPYAYTDMLARCVVFLGRRNCINLKLIESFDFERSQAILDKAYSVSGSIHKIIEDALRWCPYNINIYTKAKQCGLFNEKMQVLAKALHLNIVPSSGNLNSDVERLAAIRKKILPAQNRLVADVSYVAGLNVDGTILFWGSNDHRCEMSSWRGIKALSAGFHHSVALKRDNTVISSKYGKLHERDTEPYHGQCEVSEWKDIVGVSSCWNHTVGLKSDGSVVAVGDNDLGQCEVSDLKDIVSVSAGSDYTLGLKADGTVVYVSIDYQKRREVAKWTDIVAISAGECHAVGLKANGTVVAVGENYLGETEVSQWTDIVAISAGSQHTVGLKADGSVVAVGCNTNAECEVSEWSDIVAIYAGRNHTLGLKSNGTVVETDDGFSSFTDITSGWRLFQNVETIIEEEAAALKRQEEERIAEAKRKEAARIAALKKQEEEKIAELRRRKEQRDKQQRRTEGLCQHCGGTFKGLFSKKCSSCGMRKDY